MSDAAVERPNRSSGDSCVGPRHLSDRPGGGHSAPLPPASGIASGLPRRTGRASNRKGEHCFRTVQSPPATMNGTRSSGFVVLAHERRRVVHINVTDVPTAQWTAQQLVEAFPREAAPRYLLRDRDAVHGVAFSSRVQALGIPHSPRLASGVTPGGRPAAAQRLDQEHGGHHPTTAEVHRGPARCPGPWSAPRPRRGS
jgi:hypothetical protein